MDNFNSKNETKKEIVKAIFIIGVCLWLIPILISCMEEQLNTPEEIPYEKEMVDDDEIESNP